MRKHLLVVILLCAAVLTTCAHPRKTTKKKSAKKPVAAAMSSKGLTVVSMRRGACFGRCPEYILILQRDGTAEYHGVRNVDKVGIYKKSLGAEKVAGLFKEFEKNRADTCQDLYRARIPDVPGIYYELTIGGRKKVIGNAHFGPFYLMSLAKDMDEIAGMPDATWKKISDVPEE